MLGVGIPVDLGQGLPVQVQLHRTVPDIGFNLIISQAAVLSSIEMRAEHAGDPDLICSEVANVAGQKGPGGGRHRLSQLGVHLEHCPGSGADLFHRKRREVGLLPGPSGHGPDIRGGGAQVETTQVIEDIAPVQLLGNLVGQVYVHR